MLFWLLFLPGVSLPQQAAGPLPFSALGEASRIALRDLPALALVLYLARRSLPFSLMPRPRRSDALASTAAFIGLVLISAASAFAASRFGVTAKQAFVQTPQDAAGWIVALASCAATGYLEETYFRGYLVTKLEALGMPAIQTIAASTTLFALCHLYEGPWGVLNAAVAGGMLAVVFMRRRSVHPLAWAHAAYNAFVYASCL